MLSSLTWLACGLVALTAGSVLFMASPLFGAALFLAAAMVGVLSVIVGGFCLVQAVLGGWRMLEQIAGRAPR